MMFTTMAKMSTEVIEKYQLLFSRDPDSKIFAPLAEAYRQMKMMKEAEQVARHGVQKHPQFSGGLVTLGKVLLDTQRPEEAAHYLKRAAQIDPENILAHQLLAGIYIDQKKPMEALKAYKMVLFLNPHSHKTQKAIERLESVSAEEYDEDVFKMSPLLEAAPDEDLAEQVASEATVMQSSQLNKQMAPGLERLLSMVDAYIVRNDLDRAEALLERARQQFGHHAMIENRQNILRGSEQEEETPLSPLKPREDRIKHAKLQILQGLLDRIDAYRQKTYELM